jgi:plastocyanin
VRPGENRRRFNDLQGNRQPILIIFQSLLLFSVLGMSAMAVGSELVNAPIKMEHWPPYYYPHEAVVLAGVPIQWINATASPHTVRHDDCGRDLPCLFDSGKVDAGETYTLSGLPPGRYPYHCELHPIMGGTLIVEDPDEGTSPAAEPPSS